MTKIFSPWMQLRRLSKENWFLALAMLVNRMGHMALPFLMLYLTKDRGWSPAQSGFVFTVYGICSLMASLLSGHLSDIFSPLTLIRSALALTAVVIALIPLIETYENLLVLVGLWALVAEAVRPATMTMINTITPAGDRKLGFVLHRLAVNLGMSIGPLMGGYLAEKSFSILFWVNSAVLVVTVSLLFLIRSTKPRAKTAVLQTENFEGPTLSAIQNPRFLLFLCGIICMHCIYVQHESVLPLFLTKDLGLAVRFYGICMAINTVLIVLFEIPLNVRMSHWSHRRSLTVGLLLYGLAFGSLAFAEDFTWVVGAAIVWTIAEMIESPAVSATVADFAPPRKMGQYSGMLTFAYSLSMSFGPWAGTLIYQLWGAPSVWMGCMLVSLVGILAIRMGISSLPKRR